MGVVQEVLSLSLIMVGLLVYLLAFLLAILVYFDLSGAQEWCYRRLSSIPGFRSGVRWKATLAVLGYLTLSGMLLMSASAAVAPESGQPNSTNEATTTTTTPTQTSSDNLLEVSIVDSSSNREGTVFRAFQIEIRADTMLRDADSGEDDYGDPLFIVEINGEEVAELEDSPRKSNGVYTIDIHQDATEPFSKGDEFEVKVILYDEDAFSDDRIESVTKVVEYGERKTTTSTTSEPALTVQTPTDSDSQTPTTEETTSTTTEQTTEITETTTKNSEDEYYSSILEIAFASEGIYTESIEVSNGRANGGNKAVVVKYASTATSSGELAYEIGGFTGAFTSVVEDGWDIDVMVVHIQETNGETAVTIYIREKWVQSYLRGEISQDELLSKVIESGETH